MSKHFILPTHYLKVHTHKETTRKDLEYNQSVLVTIKMCNTSLKSVLQSGIYLSNRSMWVHRETNSGNVAKALAGITDHRVIQGLLQLTLIVNMTSGECHDFVRGFVLRVLMAVTPEVNKTKGKSV